MYVKQLPTQERLNELFNYDPATGILTWKVRKTMRKPVGSMAGGINGDGYTTVRIDNCAYLAHRLVWKMIHGQDPNVIDHVNRNRNDNRMDNLRNCTTADNAANRCMHSNNTSGYTGVSWKKDKQQWGSQITMHGRCIKLGNFDTAIEASELFQKASRLRDRLHSNAKMFTSLALNHGIYMLPIKYLSFKEDDLIKAMQEVFGGEE